MRVLVTISRDWDDYYAILSVIDDLLSPSEDLLSPFPDVTIVHGASQMDWFIAGVAYGLGAKLEAHPADWHNLGKGAGMARNVEMVRSDIDLCLAFIKNESRGASHCALRAEHAGIPTRRYTAE